MIEQYLCVLTSVIILVIVDSITTVLVVGACCMVTCIITAVSTRGNTFFVVFPSFDRPYITADIAGGIKHIAMVLYYSVEIVFPLENKKRISKRTFLTVLTI